MDTATVVGSLITLAVISGELFAREFIKQALEKIFGTGKKVMVTVIFVGVIALTAGALGFLSFSLLSPTDDTAPPSIETTVIEAQPTKLETYVEGAEVALDVIGDMVDRKQHKDSVELAERAEQWVFQIGVNIGDKSQVIAEYQRLKHLENLAVFKLSKRSYILFIDERLTKPEMDQRLEALKSDLDSLQVRVSILDLMSECKVRRQPTKTSDIKIKRTDIVIPCYECAK
jgi:hypothetical protein